jgi:glycosyltransferase involved in cell wall biosynthesis
MSAPTPIRILVAHQSADLYGSDRSLLELVEGLATPAGPFEFVVCLPEEGPLLRLLAARGIETHVVSLMKISRAVFRWWRLARLPFALIRAHRGIDAVVRGRRIDLVYTNTLAVLAAALWAKRRHLPHIWHVREIVRHPLVVARLFGIAALMLSRRVVCNSCETRAWICNGRSGFHNAVVVWNGVEAGDGRALDDEHRRLKLALDVDPACPLVLMVGRINAWKGQDLLVDAVERLHEGACRNFVVVFLGSPPPGGSDYLRALEARVVRSPAARRIRIHSFVADVTRYYRAADIVVVPSREPEPFGRVAIEAMAHSVPVIAAGHGGLKEIVVDGQTGLLFEPNRAEALAEALKRLLASEALRREMGQAARLRQVDRFSIDAYRRAMARQFREVALAR